MATQRKTTKNKKSLKAHIRSSLTYVAEHKHTGKRLRHQHTSHGVLLILLIATGVMLFMNLGALSAAGLTSSGTVDVSLTVPGPAPTQGAEITNIPDQSTVTEALLALSGTCPADTIVAIYNNGFSVGSTTCAIGGTFELTIQLQQGTNTLQAQNYDNLNQPGPATSQKTVLYQPPQQPEPNEEPEVNTPETITPTPSIPVEPAPQPTEEPCQDLTAPKTSKLTLTVPCITRNIFIGERFELPVWISGGLNPYALSIDWGDSTDAEVFVLQDAGRHVLSHTYRTPQIRQLGLKIVDSEGASYRVNTVVQVNSNASGAGFSGDNPLENFANAVATHWVEASVPLYWAGVSLFLGFWVGDIFNRFFGNTKKAKKRHA